MSDSDALYRGEPLPVGSKGRLSSGWWGMVVLIATEAALFAYLLFSYFYISGQVVGPWPPGGLPKLDLAIPGTVILLAGSVAMWWGEKGIRAGRRTPLLVGLAASVLLGMAFVALEGYEWSRKDFTPSSHAYGSLYFTVTGFHLAHVLIGVVMLIMLFIWTLLGYFGERRHSTIAIAALYWHFVTVVWIAVFASLYVSPYFYQ